MVLTVRFSGLKTNVSTHLPTGYSIVTVILLVKTNFNSPDLHLSDLVLFSFDYCITQTQMTICVPGLIFLTAFVNSHFSLVKEVSRTLEPVSQI